MADLIKSRLDFYKITDRDRELLKRVWPVVDKKLPQILDNFYDHVMTAGNLAAIIGDEARIPGLKKAQAAHWALLFSAVFDDAYVKRVSDIAGAHERIGLEPQWYLGGYTFTLVALQQTVVEAFGRSKELSDMLAAVTKAVLLDTEIVISLYYEAVQQTYRNRLDNLSDTFQRQVSSVVEAVASSSTELSASAEALTSQAQSLNDKAISSSKASEESGQNVQSVATASEELTSSIREISNQTTRASDIAGNASVTAKTAEGKVSDLSEAAEEIGDVVGLIEQIAAQTNLLALNATIEAARAGEAGKGFAVVANEVKSLASQTANATREISDKVGLIQSTTVESATAIREITEVIGQISEITIGTSGAVEEQSAATDEISRSIQLAAAGAGTVQSTISDVATISQDTSAAAAQVKSATDELSRQAENLTGDVERFLVELKSSAS